MKKVKPYYSENEISLFFQSSVKRQVALALKKYGWIQVYISRMMKISEANVSQLVKGRRGTSYDFTDEEMNEIFKIAGRIYKQPDKCCDFTAELVQKLWNQRTSYV